MALVLRVFADAAGAAGNPLGVILDAEALPAARRQQIAAQLGYSETIFVSGDARIRIHTPTTELPFAGHPLVGAAWLLGCDRLHPPCGAVAARRDGDRAWIAAPPQDEPAWELEQLRSPDEVEALATRAGGHVSCWAWIDETRGLVRARVFAPDYGVAEDPATGSAALALCARLGRPLTILQGTPRSEIHVLPLADGTIELGGRVLRDA